jgi:hypothetical protein
MKYDLTNHDITVVLTSCGRLEQLSRTLEAFHTYYIPSRFILMEDKADLSIKEYCEKNFAHIEVILNQPQLGQMASIDKAYGLVKSRYIMHLEDDWHFESGVDLKDCTDLLESNETLSCICLRQIDYLDAKYIEKTEDLYQGNSSFKRMKTNAHPEWFGHTFNPSILKTSLWLDFGPYKKYVTEENLSLKMKKINRSIAFLLPGLCTHIGKGYHVHDPFQPQRKRNFWGRQKRSIEKRINRIKRLFEK